jgi:hypothetical protein
MISDLLQEFKLQKEVHDKIPSLEIDTLADFAVIFGDLNYRLNETFPAYMRGDFDPIKDF